MFTAAIVMLPLVMMRLVAMQFVPMTTVIGTIVLPTNLLARDFRLNLLSVIIPSIARRDRNIWFSRCAAKVGKNGLLLNLTAACGDSVSSFFFLSKCESDFLFLREWVVTTHFGGFFPGFRI